MNLKENGFGLLLTGAAQRVSVAALVVVLLWTGFFWATGLPLPFLRAD
ncbi:hypothetical protein [Actibacterium mucosum]|nr:hypothetical protein [Actibacterium mucosum]